MNLSPTETTETLCAICGGNHNCSNCNLFEITNHVPDNNVLPKARLTLPKNFKIETMAEGHHSVVSLELVPKGTLLGPLEANRIFSLNPDITFPLKIFTNDEDDYFGEYYLNTINECECNWMMYIMSAPNYEEQNLICYQDKEKIYYLSIRDIQQGEHLKVWYAPFYAKKMNKHILEKRILEDVPRDAGIDISVLVKKQNIPERESWTCKFCSIMETNVVNFAKHMSEHYANQLRNQCEFCKATFTTRKSLAKHIKLIHSNGVVSYPTNNEKPASKSAEKNNVDRDVLVGGPLLNDIIGDSMDNTNVLLPQTDFEIGLANQNIMLETENLNVENLLSENVKELDHFNFEIDENQEQFICDICLKEFSKLKALYIHLNKHTGKFNCQICKKIFARKENFHAHECTSSNQSYQCTICSKIFSLRKYLIRHMKSHEKTFKCIKCYKRYSSETALNEHSCSGELAKDKKCKCELCGKEFLKDAYLRKHLKIHTDRKKNKEKKNENGGQNLYICEICSMSFTFMSNLNTHMKTHSCPTYSCETCDAKFHRKDTLENHKETHSQKPNEFQCNICQKNLKTKKYLQAHIKLHEGSMFSCSECPMTFSLKVNMKKHYLRLHKKKCTTCNKSFSTHEEALAHKAVHFDSFYTCPVCERNVKLRSSMRRHIKKTHPEYNITEHELKKCRVNNGSKEVTREENQKETNDDEVSMDVSNSNELDQQCSENFNNSTESSSSKENGCTVVEESQRLTSLLSENYESTDLSSLDVNDQIDKTIGMDQTDYDVDEFDEIDLNIAEKLVNNEEVPTNFTMSNFNQQSDLGIPITSNLESTENILDFNNLEMEFDRPFNTQPELPAPVCVSMPEIMQDVTLGENAYMLDNGTIIEPRDQGNVVVYILDRKFDTNNGANKNNLV